MTYDYTYELKLNFKVRAGNEEEAEKALRLALENMMDVTVEGSLDIDYPVESNDPNMEE